MTYSATATSKKSDENARQWKSEIPLSQGAEVRLSQGNNGAHALQALAEAAISGWVDESDRWSPRKGLGLVGLASFFLWALVIAIAG